MRYLILGLLVTLVGCAVPHQKPLTPEERAAALAAEVEYVRTNFGPACAQYHPVNSEAWSNCAVALYADEEQKKAQAARHSAEMGAYFGRALQQFGNTAFPVNMPPRPTQCRWVGSIWTCQ